MQIVVVGGGVSGLGAAVALSRRGHSVTIVERDDTPMPSSADEAFEWDRRGAPQVRHSHAFLARMVGLLRNDYPDIHASLLDAGATEMRFGDDLPPTVVGFEREPADDDLTMLACRRTTFEWVLRRAVLDEGRVAVRTGVAVDGFATAPGPHTVVGADGACATVPHVVGVRLADGGELRADLVVVAAGRRSASSDWLAAIGAGDVTEDVDDTGIVYFSRFYRLRSDSDYPPRSGPIGGDLGYLKYGVFVGDNRTFSVTLAAPSTDDDLRRVLADPVVFDACARQLTATATWLDGRAEPMSDDVHVMAGLLNRRRHHVVDGVPVALGVVPVGDAALCTNPLYGRGCTFAFVGAHLLADVLDRVGDDLGALATEYDAALTSDLVPWYQAAVQQDAEARRVAAALLAGEDPDGDATDPRSFMRSVFRDGLLPAIRTDAVVMRAFFRSLNLLSAPDALMKDADVGARVLAVWQGRDSRPPEEPLGPRTRAELRALLPA
ncbi:MAG: NAD(P)/FAD-dependent oxidoreductase [Ilumatobacteraceae bacterium]